VFILKNLACYYFSRFSTFWPTVPQIVPCGLDRSKNEASYNPDHFQDEDASFFWDESLLSEWRSAAKSHLIGFKRRRHFAVPQRVFRQAGQRCLGESILHSPEAESPRWDTDYADYADEHGINIRGYLRIPRIPRSITHM
jgi:hypothetical protein